MEAVHHPLPQIVIVVDDGMTVEAAWGHGGLHTAGDQWPRIPRVRSAPVHASGSRGAHVRRAEIPDWLSEGAPQESYLYLLARIAPQWWQTRVSELTLPAQ